MRLQLRDLHTLAKWLAFRNFWPCAGKLVLLPCNFPPKSLHFLVSSLFEFWTLPICLVLSISSVALEGSTVLAMSIALDNFSVAPSLMRRSLTFGEFGPNTIRYRTTRPCRKNLQSLRRSLSSVMNWSTGWSWTLLWNLYLAKTAFPFGVT